MIEQRTRLDNKWGMDDLAITDVPHTVIVLSIDAARRIRRMSVRSSIPEAGEHEMAQAP